MTYHEHKHTPVTNESGTAIDGKINLPPIAGSEGQSVIIEQTSVKSTSADGTITVVLTSMDDGATVSGTIDPHIVSKSLSWQFARNAGSIFSIGADTAYVTIQVEANPGFKLYQIESEVFVATGGPTVQ